MCADGRSVEGVLDVVLVPLRGIAGNHLADEPGEEQHHAEDDCKDGKVEKWLIGDSPEMYSLRLVDEFGYDYPNRHHKTHKKHQQA